MTDELLEAVEDGPPPCSMPGCTSLKDPKAGGGMCRAHYERCKRNGTPWPVPRRLETRPEGLTLPLSEMSWARFMAKVQVTDGCWVWTASKSRGGYGMFKLDKARSAHRVSYMHHFGAIDDAVHLDHLCRNRACVNPEHLEAVTPRTNWERGEGVARINAAKTHCIRGHEFTPENTIPNGPTGRGCRACSVRVLNCDTCGRAVGRPNMARHRRTHHGGSNAASSR